MKVDTHHPVADQLQRDQALDPGHSCIVQAPAGSGKTELLIQRYLTLLACVDAPEEVIALTFTRKAAAEMRSRVLQALQSAQGAAPQQSHERKTWELASAVLDKDRTLGWDLHENPVRLSIQTIDSLCSSLTRQMPMLSRFGSQPAVVEDAEDLYRQAARQTLSRLEAGDQWTEATANLLRHLQNDLARAEKMLISMLQKRDQWLRHIVSVRSQHAGRAELETALVTLIEDTLSRLRLHVPPDLAQQWVKLANRAATYLQQHAPDAPAVACAGLEQLPGIDFSDRVFWLALVDLVLTKDNNWRKKIDKRQGFPAASDFRDKEEKESAKQNKEYVQELIMALSEVPGLHMYLEELRQLPPERYSEHQWRIIDSLVQLLPLAAAQLELVFQSTGQVDFTAVSQGAIRALGETDAPTDLALALDYRIRHLLIDEFQDTSLSQYELLTRLTAGWQPGDGRTIFAVGDPMQSIYRFREAEVGLYLRAREAGLGDLMLTPLTLEVNFRSRPSVVDWVNETFRSVFPGEEDVTLGAVTYSDSVAQREPSQNQAIAVYPAADKRAEAAQVVALIQEIRRNQTGATIAVLVRSRSHLAEIVPLLHKTGQRFQALEIETLGSRQAVQDVYSLTRALMHPGDRVAWLGILRAPWCGLNTKDLLCLVEGAPQKTLWSLLQDEKRLALLSPKGQQRLQRMIVVLAHSLSQARRQALRSWVEQAWLRLGGPACIEDETDLEDVEVYLSLLEQLDCHGDLASFADLKRGVDKLWALPDAEADGGLQVMTIHKAKGLQFDHVILPGLDRTIKSSESQLLRWTERPTQKGGSDLLLAPVRADGSEGDAVYQYLGYLEDKRQHHEDGRLLYVAATRARECLHLAGVIPVKEKNGSMEFGKPATNSLLNLLWHRVSGDFENAFNQLPDHTGAEKDTKKEIGYLDVQGVQALAPGWQCPPPASPVSPAGAQMRPQWNEPEIEFEWVGESARHVGTVVHRCLMRIAHEGLASWSVERIRSLESAVSQQLAALGVTHDDRTAAVKRVLRALEFTLQDDRGRWLLDEKHEEKRNEWALSAWYREDLVNVIIDRTFVDKDGVRWIIDYKTSVHEGADVDSFLDQEQVRYQPQLQRYARILSAMESRPTRLALYFPLLRGWREWPAAPDQ